MRRLLLALLALILLAILAIAVWVAYATHARSLREVHTPEQIAAGQGRWVRLADSTLHVREWQGANARAPVLVLVHGTGAWSGTWFGLPGALAAAGWHVVALDLPPFGLSSTDRSPADYSRAAQARRIIGVLDDLATPVVLMGHSFGAGPALEAALGAGAKVRRLVLVDPALGLGPNGEPPHCESGSGAPLVLAYRPLRGAVIASTATWPGLTPTLLRSFVHRKDVVTPALVPAYQVPFAREGFSARLGDWAAEFATGACEPALSLDARAVAAWRPERPVALIWGAEDTITPIAQAAALQRAMPGTTLRVLPGAGHIPHIEDPDAFAVSLLAVVDGDR